MGLGQLYKPKGLARETAQVVLEVEEPYAVNVAWGCPNGCLYCYGPLVGRQSREEWRNVRLPTVEPVELVKRQLDSGLYPDGVFISFETDPFVEQNRRNTEHLIELLLSRGIRVATSSKVDVSSHLGVRHGMTVVSLDDGFCRRWEPRAPTPKERIRKLEEKYRLGEYVWVSMEPCPPPAIWKQNLAALLEAIKFVNFIVKGKWNYDSRANTPEAREDYVRIMAEFRDFCKSNGIRYHIKSDTLNFIRGKP